MVDGQRVASGLGIEVDGDEERVLCEADRGRRGRGRIFGPATLAQLDLVEGHHGVEVGGFDFLGNAFGVGKAGPFIEDRRPGWAWERLDQRFGEVDICTADLRGQLGAVHQLDDGHPAQ